MGSEEGTLQQELSRYQKKEKMAMGTRNAGTFYQPKEEYIITDPMSVARSSK